MPDCMLAADEEKALLVWCDHPNKIVVNVDFILRKLLAALGRCNCVYLSLLIIFGSKLSPLRHIDQLHIIICIPCILRLIT
jgi:hypothetical protein